MEKLSILKTITERVTSQIHLKLPQESFSLRSSEIFIENESLTINFYQFDGGYSIGILEKKSQKNVSLNFYSEDEISGFIHSYTLRKKSVLKFWKKSDLQIKGHICYSIIEENKNCDENIQFVWDRIPNFLINLK